MITAIHACFGLWKSGKSNAYNTFDLFIFFKYESPKFTISMRKGRVEYVNFLQTSVIKNLPVKLFTKLQFFRGG